MRALAVITVVICAATGAQAQVTETEKTVFMNALAQVGCKVTDEATGNKIMAITGMDEPKLTAIVQELGAQGAMVPVYDGLELVVGPCKK